MRIKNIKLIAFASLFCFMSNAFAQGGGFLMGVQIGQSKLNNESMLVYTGSNGNDAAFGTIPSDAPACTAPNVPAGCQYVVDTSPSNTGFGLRLYGGMGFNRYVSVETGLAYFTPSEYDPDVPGATKTHQPQIREYAFDILAKLTLPVRDFGIFVKGGMAAVYKSSSGALFDDGEGTDDVYVRPEIGFGVSYSFSSLTVDISTNRISGNSDLEGINFTALGITYQIVDKYCGQFLC